MEGADHARFCRAISATLRNFGAARAASMGHSFRGSGEMMRAADAAAIRDDSSDRRDADHHRRQESEYDRAQPQHGLQASGEPHMAQSANLQVHPD